MNSIQLRVLAVASASIIVTLAVVGVSLVLVFERQVERYLERDLNIRWTELAAAFSVNAEGQPELNRTLADPRYQRPYGGAYWQVSEGGYAVLRSRSLWDKELPQRPHQGVEAAEPWEAEGPNGSRLYVVEQGVRVEPQSGSSVYSLAVALDQIEVMERRQAFSWDVARILVPIAAVLMLFAWLQIWLGLRPLRRVGEQLAAVQRGQINRMRGGFPDEVASLVDSIDRLLDRQEALVRKARDRAGALAHGLKTPLTILGGEVRRLEQKGLRDEAQRIQEQLNSMYSHVDRELARSRASGASVGSGASTAVEDTINRLLKLMQHMPRGESITWETEISANLQANIDPHDFGEILGNLLDNARKWARSRVMVRAETRGDRAWIAVEDDGPGFAGDHGARPPRGLTGKSDGESSGLGLGIVEDILAEYGTAPVIQHDGRFSVAFEIPVCPETPSRKGVHTQA